MRERTAVVTGAAGTLGQGMVEKLLEHGRRVVLVDRDDDKLTEAVDRWANHGDVLGVALDLGDEAAPAALAARIERYGWQPPAIVVNNAGISIKHNGRAHDVVEISMEEWQLMIRINLTAPLLMAKQFLPFMKAQQWGRIVNIASRAGRHRPNQAGPAYVTTKAGVVGLSRSIANDFSKYGVSCNAIAPGLVPSGMTGQLTAEMMKGMVSQIAVGRSGTPQEVGSAVAYLTSEDAGFITGVCLDVNGGQSMS